MPAHDIETLLDWRGSTVVDRDGEKIGTLKELYLDQDDRPAWGAVDTGLFGLRQTFIPLSEARPVDGGVQVPFAAEHVKDAPNVDPDAQLTEEEERRLYRHYELASPDADDGEPRAERPAATSDSEATGDPAGSGEPSGGAAMTRSEEELVVGTRRRVRGKARLRKYVVTEHVQRTIPVQREEVRVEYEPEDPAGEPAEDPAGEPAEDPAGEPADVPPDRPS